MKLTFLYTHGLEAFYILPTLQKNDKLLENICSGLKPHNIIYFDVHGQIKFSKKKGVDHVMQFQASQLHFVF